MICKALTRAKHADAVQLLRLPAENCFGRGVTDACNIPAQLDRREILSGAADQHAGVITAFDKSYTQFERLYMTIVEQLMETTLEPLRSMAKTQEKGLVASFSAAAAAAEKKAEAAAIKLKEAEARKRKAMASVTRVLLAPS
eukprot:s3564_g3.t1